jgi:uncharacterized repeat protein (TIGR04138 family)
MIAPNHECSLRSRGRLGLILMSLRSELMGVIARDSRYSIHAYAFILEALEYSKSLRIRTARPLSNRNRQASRSNHVTGPQLCEGFRRLALEHYGLMALAVLRLWGIHSTSDVGDIVYNLIASGDLEKTPSDSRADFDNVFEFEHVFRRDFVLRLDEVA